MPFIPNMFKVDDMRKAILQDFPDVPITSVKLVNNGWDNAVLEVNGEYIFRFPKDGTYKFEEEVWLLEFLRGKITLSIPDPKFIGKSLTYMGYKKIEGGDLTEAIFATLTESEKERVAYDMANFLAEFHRAVSIDTFQKFHTTEESTHTRVEDLFGILASVISDKPILDLISETIEELASIVEDTRDRVVLYHDLHTENVAFDPVSKKLRGIFDFGDASVGDVHREFGGLRGPDRWLFEHVIAAFEVLTGRKISRRRAMLYMRVGVMYDLAEHIDQPETRIYQDAIRKIASWVQERDIYKTEQ